MSDVIELEDVSVETRRNPLRSEVTTRDTPAVSEERRGDEDRVLGGLARQDEEDDWWI